MKLVLILIPFLLIACGGSDDNSETKTATSSQSYDEICVDGIMHSIYTEVDQFKNIITEMNIITDEHGMAVECDGDPETDGTIPETPKDTAWKTYTPGIID